MPPRKKKASDTQQKLEDVTDQDVKLTKSKVGDLTHPTKETKRSARKSTNEQGPQKEESDLFLKRRANKTGISQAPADKKHKTEPKGEPQGTTSCGSEAGIWINRAPALTLWVSIVAQQQGYSKKAGNAHLKLLQSALALR
jgi:hypothetical protein